MSTREFHVVWPRWRSTHVNPWLSCARCPCPPEEQVLGGFRSADYDYGLWLWGGQLLGDDFETLRTKSTTAMLQVGPVAFSHFCSLSVGWRWLHHLTRCGSCWSGLPQQKTPRSIEPWIWGKRRWFNLLSGKCPIDSRHFPRNKQYSFSTRTPLSKTNRLLSRSWRDGPLGSFWGRCGSSGGTSANFEQVTSLFGEQPLIQDFTWGRC